LGKEEEMAERKAGRARKTKLPLKLDLPLIDQRGSNMPKTVCELGWG